MEIHSRQSLYEVHGVGARTRTQSWLLQLIQGIVRLLAKLARALMTEIQARRAAAELHSLDDRMLRDIGVNRCEIDRVVRRPRLGPRPRTQSAPEMQERTRVTSMLDVKPGRRIPKY